MSSVDDTKLRLQINGSEINTSIDINKTSTKLFLTRPLQLLKKRILHLPSYSCKTTLSRLMSEEIIMQGSFYNQQYF